MTQGTPSAYKWMTLFNVATILVVPTLFTLGAGVGGNPHFSLGGGFALWLLVRAAVWLVALAGVLFSSFSLASRGGSQARRVATWFGSILGLGAMTRFDSFTFVLGLVGFGLIIVGMPIVWWWKAAREDAGELQMLGLGGDEAKNARYQGRPTPSHESGREKRSAL